MVTVLRARARESAINDAGVGERLDEGILLCDGPPVVTRADWDWGEGRLRIGFAHMILREPYGNI